jgi:hypothetical protein
MKSLEFKITIAANQRHVWETMLQPDTYRKWVMESWPNSTYEGTWAQDEEVRFIGPDGSGTLARIVVYQPYERMLAEHIGIIKAGGEIDKDSDMSKGWIGTMEEYRFVSNGSETELTVIITTSPAWEEMFNADWPKALQTLKRISEA